MWNNNAAAGGGNYYGHQPPPSAHSSSNTSGQKHDIFVGNLAFSTTEEQLYAAFSELGRIIKVRMVSDLETGKPRGFAFIEFEDPQAALSAIRNMNEYEINGRRIRVNFSNSSHLETLANQLGMDLSHVTGKGPGGGGGGKKDENKSAGAVGGAGGPGAVGGPGGVTGSKAVAAALRGMNKGEMYDVVAKLKEISDSNPDEARKLLTQHPQLPEAILYCMSELDMIKTPMSGIPGMGLTGIPAPDLSVPPPFAASAAKPLDPRARTAPAVPPMAPPTMGLPSDPRSRPVDPRAAARDPRAAAASAPNFPPPPMMQPPPAVPPPPMPGIPGQPPPPAQPPGTGVSGLDPNLVQQVMALTPAQIAQLPPDKQQSIIALRQQITGGVRR
ncbi:hypothetical protein ACHAWF_003990 [Thalassiosira exigua]